jgi:hypothetical protein
VPFVPERQGDIKARLVKHFGRGLTECFLVLDQENAVRVIKHVVRYGDLLPGCRSLPRLARYQRSPVLARRSLR